VITIRPIFFYCNTLLFIPLLMNNLLLYFLYWKLTKSAADNYRPYG